MLLLRLSILLTSLVSILACTCQRHHPQEHFCKSEYVIRLKVIGGVQTDEPWNSETLFDGLRFEKIYYPVRITKVYKGNMTTIKDVKIVRRSSGKTHYLAKLHVLPRISSCSVSFVEDQTYVVMGQIHDGALHYHLCDMRSTWRDITGVQRHGLKRQYAKGCGCQIRTCPSRRWCKESHLVTECQFISNKAHLARRCLDKYQVCKYNSIARSCKWREPDHPSFKQCLQRKKSLSGS